MIERNWHFVIIFRTSNQNTTNYEGNFFPSVRPRNIFH